MFVLQLYSISCLNTMSIPFCATYCTLSPAAVIHEKGVGMVVDKVEGFEDGFRELFQCVRGRYAQMAVTAGAIADGNNT